MAGSMATSASAQDVFNWRMQSNLPSGEAGYLSVELYFTEVLREMSDGRLNIQLFPVGALFPVQEGLEAVGMGIAEIGMMTGGYFSGKMGPIATLESGVPGAERSAWERYVFFYKKGFLDLMREAYAPYGVFYAGPHISPQWDIMSTVPITSAADFDGIKIRAFGVEAQWYEALGASSVFLGGGEIYTALATGVVDAARWSGPTANFQGSYHEVADYYIQPSPMPAPNNNILINQEAWDSLPADLQSMLEQVTKLASIDYVARAVESDAAAIAAMQEAGMEFVTIPADEWATMEQEARKLWSAYADSDPLSAQAVEMMQAYLGDLGR
jgi:TRAP-type mannitol/chloroaromatic compound transport system substrate-binding protein